MDTRHFDTHLRSDGEDSDLDAEGEDEEEFDDGEEDDLDTDEGAMRPATTSSSSTQRRGAAGIIAATPGTGTINSSRTGTTAKSTGVTASGRKRRPEERKHQCGECE
jgi:hypothetical protein